MVYTYMSAIRSAFDGINTRLGAVIAVIAHVARLAIRRGRHSRVD